MLDTPRVTANATATFAVYSVGLKRCTFEFLTSADGLLYQELVVSEFACLHRHVMHQLEIG